MLGKRKLAYNLGIFLGLVILATAPVAMAEQATAPAAPPATAAPATAAPAAQTPVSPTPAEQNAQVKEDVTIKLLNQMNQLLIDLIDLRASLILEARADELIRKQLDENIYLMEASISELKKTMAADKAEIQTVLMVHDEQLNEFDMKLVTATEAIHKVLEEETAALEKNIQRIDAVDTAQNAALDNLIKADRGLNTRLWIALGASALGLILSLVK